MIVFTGDNIAYILRSSSDNIANFYPLARRLAPDRDPKRRKKKTPGPRRSPTSPTSPHHAERRKSVAGALERHLGDPAILLHPADQIIDRVELKFRPDPRDYRHVEATVV